MDAQVSMYVVCMYVDLYCLLLTDYLILLFAVIKITPVNLLSILLNSFFCIKNVPLSLQDWSQWGHRPFRFSSASHERNHQQHSDQTGPPLQQNTGEQQQPCHHRITGWSSQRDILGLYVNICRFRFTTRLWSTSITTW